VSNILNQKLVNMKKSHMIILVILSMTGILSCVSSKKMKAEKAKSDEAINLSLKLQEDLMVCQDEKLGLQKHNTTLEDAITILNGQIAFLRENNTTALKQLEDLSVISGRQAESIKRSLENIGAKDAYIQDLQSAIAHKDSLNMALILNLKGAIGNIDDRDIDIKVEKGVVYIDISDKLLFKSGSYEITSKAKTVLAKVAQVLKNQSDIEFMVEGHTDNVPFRKGMLQDNWDLSVKRATSVARILQNQFGIQPSKIVAAGRAEFQPIASNDNSNGRAANRRTRIVILPQLDQFFKLLEPQG
jgi:chemotaxis protein MotB